MPATPYIPRTPCLEPLERRTHLAATPWVGPSEREQQAIELINRLRLSPAAELPRLLNSKDSAVQSAISFFHVNRNLLVSQWAELSPAPALAWSQPLTTAAYLHNLRMTKYDRQAHDLPGEAPLVTRTANAGYANAQFIGENVYAFMQSVEHAHAGFAIDWGSTPSGIQSPAGHRDNVMASVYTEVGMSITDTLPGKITGPYLITENFGVRRNQTKPYLLGVVYTDRNGDGAYTPGEGATGATITVTGAAGTFTTTSMSAGGYQLNLPQGVYSMTIKGGGMRGTASLSSVTIGLDNVKRDFTAPSFASADVTAPQATLATSDISGGQASHLFSVTYTDQSGIDVSSLSSGDVLVTGPNGYSVAATLLNVDQATNGVARTATYRINSPGWSFDAADNGLYTVTTVANQVRDVVGNTLPPQPLGNFTVNLPPVFLNTAGLLNITGTSGNDKIDVAITSSRTRSFVQVTLNGHSDFFAYRSIARINIQGLAGNDMITLARNLIGTSIDGGDGHDIIYATDNSDYIIGGAGDDIIYAYFGKDFISAGPGFDRVQQAPTATVQSVEKFLRA